MLQVDQFMTKNVYSVKENTHVLEAVNMLIRQNVSGLPVVDENGLLIGIVSEKDLLRILLDGKIGNSEVVGKYMTKNVTAFKGTDRASKVCEFFIDSNIRRVPIVDDSKKLIGVVSRRDLIKLIQKVNEKF